MFTLEFLINLGLRLLIFEAFSRVYALIWDVYLRLHINFDQFFFTNILDAFIEIFEENVDHPKINRVGYRKSPVICSFEIEKWKVATDILND